MAKLAATTGIRLTGGRFSSKMITAPAQLTRPSSARARKALFDLLTHRVGVDFAQSPVLDIFAGAGTLGFEALSRRSPHAIFIDHRRAAVRQIAKNAQALGVADICYPLQRDALRPARRPQKLLPAQLVFADAPYRSDLASGAIAAFMRGGWLADNVVVVIEDDVRHSIKLPEGFIRAAHHEAASAQFAILLPAVK